MSINNKIPFRVMRGEEITLMNKTFQEGTVYFATDTRRIYMDASLNGEVLNKLPIGGGNSGIYYASKGFTDSSDVSFTLSDIEGDELPSINDLIINYKSSNELRDGFYKVISVDSAQNKVETTYLPVGGGGSGSGGSSSGGKILITPITAANGVTTMEKGYIVEYSLEAYNNTGAAINTEGKASLNINGTTIDMGKVIHGGKYSYDIGKYLSTIKDTNTVTLKITMNTGGVVDDTQTYTWLVKCVDLKLSWDWVYNTNKYITEDKFTLNWEISGGVDCVTHISIDNGESLDVNYFTVSILASEKEGFKTLNSLPYGAHKVTMWATTVIGTEVISTSKINHILTFIRGENTHTILTVPYFSEYETQYNTIRIPFLVYKPNTEKVNITFSVDGNEVLTDEYTTTSVEPHYWPYTLGRAGEVTLKISVTNEPEIYYQTILRVSPLDLGINEPIEGKVFSLKASDISGNAQLRALDKVSFSDNFDWVNGGLKTEVDDNGNISNYICIRQGTTMTIDYKLFEKYATAGKTFKFCFKAVNCYDYEAPVLECYDENSRLGLKYNAQSALFESAANTDFRTQYCEGSYIELETEIWPDVNDKDEYHPGDRFLMFWIDGVPTAIQPYSVGTNFKQNTPKNIVIGSNQCDVYVYVIKIYEKRLSSIEHLNNFILDAPNVNEKLSRFNRNDILGSNGEISYEKLVDKNPNCHAYLYQLTENGMTTSKEDEKDCNYTEYCNDSKKPVLTAKNAKVLVQGTSSAAYGIAAFNVRTDFSGTKMYDGDGNKLDGKKVSESSIPINYTCTKVNVASCEGVNNALNQEWYNKFQPYYDGHRRKSTPSKQYRDCMEFDFGVMFVEDHNKSTDFINTDNKPDESLYTSTNVFGYNTEGKLDKTYINNPYYKQYAIANMGNDKKNRSVFHDTKNYNACCVEILDNQNAEHWMTKAPTRAEDGTWDDSSFVWGDDDTGFYEFRYSSEKYQGDAPIPNGLSKDDYAKVQAQAFLDFVNWMASCDPNEKSEAHPNGYTGAALSESITYESPKVFTGFNPPGYDDSTATGVSLKGFVVDKFAKQTFTHDTKDYRLAKLLYECEDHLVMDSVVYHYLFIQRHTMVDNVAKNTFWSTEDLQHWDLTKNYDNDTADGNDNSGYLKYSYGIEIMDRKSDGTEIFNASDSVWLNFIYNFPEIQEDLYKKLQNRTINNINVWDSKGYLQLFKEKQSLIPERCWIEDYFRKYIRPRRLGLDGSNKFIQRLEGGKKTHQRQQFETYQSYYIDSKYCSGTSFNDTGSFDMRLNKGPAIYELTTDTSPIEGKNYFEKRIVTDSGTDLGDNATTWEDYVKVTISNSSINPSELGYYEITSGGWTKNESFPVTYYIDLYPSAHIGGQKWRGSRTKKGVSSSIPVGQLLDAPTDATCYIYAANMIQTIRGIADTYPNYLGISAATKLREIEAGSDSNGYFNNKLNNAVLDRNTQLEKAYLQNVGSDKISGLDLSNLVMLKELKINGSKFPSLKLAKGGVIHTLYLNNDLTSLIVKELKSLTDNGFVYQDDILSNLTSLCIQDCPLLNEFGYKVACQETLQNYCFNDILWNIDKNGINFNDNTINVLQNLISDTKGYVEVTNKALALTGEIVIDLTGTNENIVLSEYGIYSKYKSAFPNLNISYTQESLPHLDVAPVITFYSDDDGDIIYTVKNDPNNLKSLAFLTSESGPEGISIKMPTKASDKEWDYTWNNNINESLDSWKRKSDGQTFTHAEMLNEIPQENTEFVALYQASKHKYIVKLRDFNGADIKEPFEVEYEKDARDQIPIYMYRQHSKENEGMRYEFQGWISAKDYLSGTATPEIITNFIITSDVTYYAFYKEQNCISTASRMDYFSFDGTNKIISLNPIYRYLIQEPITLPITKGNTQITTVGLFGAYNYQDSDEKIKIPTIYFLNSGVGGSYNKIADYAFWSAPEGHTGQGRLLLKEIHLPNTIKTIGTDAFKGCTELEIIELPDATQENMGITSIKGGAFNTTGKININSESLQKLTEIGVSAFYRAGPGIYLDKLPNNLTISAWSFSYCPNVSIFDFTNISSIGENAFYESGYNNMLDIILPTNISNYKTNCFERYAVGKINKVTYQGGSQVEDSVLSTLGLSYSNPVTIEQVIEQ